MIVWHTNRFSNEGGIILTSRPLIQEIVEIEEKEFADKARQLNIHSLTNFYSSDLFKAHKFVHDSKRKTITQAFWIKWNSSVPSCCQTDETFHRISSSLSTLLATKRPLLWAVWSPLFCEEHSQFLAKSCFNPRWVLRRNASIFTFQTPIHIQGK